MNLEIDKYIRCEWNELRNNPPSRCTISLDIANMFNEISRERALDIINNHFPHLAKMSNVLIEPTTCYYLEPNGNWNSFKQLEGLPQGCPFSPVFAALVLNEIIIKLDKSLR